MRGAVRNLAEWLGDMLVGPRCPFCGLRVRGWRTLDKHLKKQVCW